MTLPSPYLAVELNSVTMKARLTAEKETLTSLLQLVKIHTSDTALSIKCLLGMMSSVHTAVPRGLLNRRRLQIRFDRFCINCVCSKRRAVTVPSSAEADLSHWGNPQILLEGVPLTRHHISPCSATRPSLDFRGGVGRGGGDFLHIPNSGREVPSPHVFIPILGRERVHLFHLISLFTWSGAQLNH